MRIGTIRETPLNEQHVWQIGLTMAEFEDFDLFGRKADRRFRQSLRCVERRPLNDRMSG